MKTRTGIFVFAVSLCLGIGPGRTVFVTFKSIFTFLNDIDLIVLVPSTTRASFLSCEHEPRN